MSANLDLVRSIYAAWERGDYESPAKFMHPEMEWVGPDGPEVGSARGVADVAVAMRNFLSIWDHLRTEAQDYREIDDDRILVFVRNTGRGKASGVEVGQLMGTAAGANLFVIRDGKVVKLVTYWDRERALADLGLTPEEQRDPR